MHFEIDLKPHVGNRKTVLGEVPVDLKQDQMFAKNPDTGESRLVGYIGHQENAPINLIVNLGDDINAALEESIKKAIGERANDSKSHTPVDSPEEEQEEEQEDADDDDLQNELTDEDSEASDSE